MEVAVNRVDDANVILSGKLDNSAIAKKVDNLAIKAGKTLRVDGFRKGKVPPHVVKQLHGESLQSDAESHLLTAMIDRGLVNADISKDDVLGEPTFNKFDKKDDGIDVEIAVSVKPKFEAEGYLNILSDFEIPTVSEDEIAQRLSEIAKEKGTFVAIEESRAVENGDVTVIDFEGFIDGEPFEGGNAENFGLIIGSGEFIAGFEEQIIGMIVGQEKTVTVTFPEEYQAKNLAGKESKFEVKLHEIQKKVEAPLDDALAIEILQDEENASLEVLKERIKTQIESSKLSQLYNDKLKPKVMELLIAKFDFALPKNIVEQEIDVKIKAKEMTPEELASYKDNNEKIAELREEVREEAENSVKITFIVADLAKKEGISIDDQEVSQALYYEAMMSQQDPQEVIKYYQDNNLLPAIKMGMMEDKLFGKILGLEK
ncbi:MAG: trigger factor [Sulfurovum sp.]